MAQDARDLNAKLLVKDLSKRMSLTDIENHPWIKRNTEYDEISISGRHGRRERTALFFTQADERGR